MGFDQTPKRRVYKFDREAHGEPAARFVVSVDMELFLKYHVNIQEGPSLCAQKLTADLQAHLDGDHELTNGDLLQYVADRAAALARKAESRKPGPRRRKVEPGQPVSPWWR
jgi:hypothetical protein